MPQKDKHTGKLPLVAEPQKDNHTKKVIKDDKEIIIENEANNDGNSIK